MILPAGNKFTYYTVFENSRCKKIQMQKNSNSFGLKSCTIIHLFFFFFALTNVIVLLSSSKHFTCCSLHTSLQTVKYLFQWKIFFPLAAKIQYVFFFLILDKLNQSINMLNQCSVTFISIS